MTQPQSICARIHRTSAKLFNSPIENSFCRQIVRNNDELWVLQYWALSDDDYELQWINNCPNNSCKDGQTLKKKQGRHRVHGDAMFFLQSVREDGAYLTERWVCHGWSSMPRGFALLITASTLLFALLCRPEVHRADYGLDVSLCVASSSDTKV